MVLRKFNCNIVNFDLELGGILRVDSSLRPPKKPLYYLKQILYEIFLPREFPTSVSKDYVSYQIWDTIQVNSVTKKKKWDFAIIFVSM